MGAWGYKYYENDSAADWFAEFWENPDCDGIITRVAEFNSDNEEDITFIRAVAHLFSFFDNFFIMPEPLADEHERLSRRIIEILENPIDPTHEYHQSFVAAWGDDEEFVAEIRNDIDKLTTAVQRLYGDEQDED